MKRPMKIHGLFMFACCGLILLASCSETTILRVDFTQQRGAYVVAYTEDLVIRIRMEDQLVADLIERDMIAYVSYEDITDIVERTPQEIIDTAMQKSALGIIVINQVAADASDSIFQNPDRVSPLHPTLQEFYANSRELAGESYSEDREAFAEVNLFVLDNGEAKLFWSGTTWSFHVDNQGGAIREISNIIADQLVELREQIL